MATTATPTAWGKTKSWALDSEEHEEELNNQPPLPPPIVETSDFPSLSAAAVTKTKKKKPQAVSLHEFNTGKTYSAPKPGLTPTEQIILPTGPRERSAEELERSSSRLGGGFKSYGGGGGGGDDRWGRERGSGDDREQRRREPPPPSKADEVDDWGAAKKSLPQRSSSGGGGGGGGFFDSPSSRADESDSWVSKKSYAPSSESRRPGGGFERERRGVGFDNGGGGRADADTWGRRSGGEDGYKYNNNSNDNGNGNGNENGSSTGRPRLVLQPRTLPVTIVNVEQPQPTSASTTPATTPVIKTNPFGAARPREEVLAEKGQDWKKIDEQLDAVKIKENDVPPPRNGNRVASPDDRTANSWRKPLSIHSPTPSEGKEDGEGDNSVADIAAEN